MGKQGGRDLGKAQLLYLFGLHAKLGEQTH